MGYGIAAMPIIKKTVDLIAPPESNPKIEENKQQKAWNDAMNYKTNTFVKYQKGSKIKELSGPTIYSRNDPAFKAYQDSLNLYNNALNSETKIARIMGKPWHNKYDYEDIDRVIHPERWVKPREGGGVTTTPYKANGQYYSYDPDDPTGSKGYSTPRATIDDMIKWEQDGINYYSKYKDLKETDINGLNPGERLKIHQLSLDTLKKHKALMNTSGINPTYIIFPQERPFGLIFKKPVSQPTIAKVQPIQPKIFTTNSKSLGKRNISTSKSFTPQTDHNFYFGNAQAWKNPNREIGYYNLGNGEGRQSVTLKELQEMNPESRKGFLNSFGNKYNEQFEQFVKYQRGGVANLPTMQDSLALLNNSKAVRNYYKNKRYNNYSTTNYANLSKELYAKFNKDELKKYEEDRMDIIDGKESKIMRNKWLSSSFEKVNINEYYKKIDDNRFLQRESANAILDLRAPIQLIDKRIYPTSSEYYKNVDIKDPMYGDEVLINTYPELQVTPWKYLTRD